MSSSEEYVWKVSNVSYDCFWFLQCSDETASSEGKLPAPRGPIVVV